MQLNASRRSRSPTRWYKENVPYLRWSFPALAATNQRQRRAMTELFNAYFRAGFANNGQPVPGTILHLDVPTKTNTRYYFHARCCDDGGWEVEAKLRPEHREIRFSRSDPLTLTRMPYTALKRALWRPARSPAQISGPRRRRAGMVGATSEPAVTRPRRVCRGRLRMLPQLTLPCPRLEPLHA
jgi:hypothetical protein